MPQLSVIRDIINMIKEEKPWFIVSIGGGNLTADLCARVVPVLTVSLAPSERTVCRTTFQMTGKIPDEDDLKWVDKNIKMPKTASTTILVEEPESKILANTIPKRI